MEDVTILLIVATLLSFVLSLKINTRVVHTLVLVLSMCGIFAVLKDATILPDQLFIVFLPLVTVALFTIGFMCVTVGDGKK